MNPIDIGARPGASLLLISSVIANTSNIRSPVENICKRDYSLRTR